VGVDEGGGWTEAPGDGGTARAPHLLQNDPVSGVPQLTQKPGIVSPERSKLIVIDVGGTFPQDDQKGHNFTSVFARRALEKTSARDGSRAGLELFLR
jgi:hypothetical protein